MTKIEWTKNTDGTAGKTWNPLAGCSLASPGCTNCYAQRMAARLEHMLPSLTHYQGLTQPSKAGPVWTGKVALAPDHILLEPLKRKKPTTYFVNSMSDLFHEDVPDEWIDRVFAIMALCPQHTFQCLTKRSARMRKYLGEAWSNVRRCEIDLARQKMGLLAPQRHVGWPLSNAWLSVSVEDQRRAEERIPDLLATPASVHFISAEPLLGPLDLTKWLNFGFCNKCWQHVVGTERSGGGIVHRDCNYLAMPSANLGWVIVGGESGPSARECKTAWIGDIVGQCQRAEVAVFVKQLGARVCGKHANGVNETTLSLKSKKGADMAEWPAELRVRQMPITHKTEAAA